MITQSFINSEADLAKRIFIYYTDKILDAMEIGDKDYQQWYRDSLQISFFLKGILSTNIVGDKLYLGSGEITEATFMQFGSKIREFLNYELRQIVYSELDATDNVTPPIIPTEPPIVIVTGGSNLGWAYWAITVTEDNPTFVLLPFNIAAADVNSLTVTVNDQDPDHLVDAEAEGCHIVGATLFWHNYYELKTGDIIVIRYQRIA